MERRRADDPRIDGIQDSIAQLDKRLALVEQRQGDVIDDVRSVLTELRGLTAFRDEFLGVAKFSRVIQLLLGICVALITLGTILYGRMGT